MGFRDGTCMDKGCGTVFSALSSAAWTEEGVTDAAPGSQRSGWQMFQTLLLLVISGQRLPEVAGSHQKMGQPLLCPHPTLKQLLPMGPGFLHAPRGERVLLYFHLRCLCGLSRGTMLKS